MTLPLSTSAPRAARRAAAALACAALLTGCSPLSPAASAPAGTTTPPAGGAPAASAPVTPPSTVLPVLAARVGSLSVGALSGAVSTRIELNEVRTSGQTTTVSFTLVNTGTEAASPSYLFSDGVAQVPGHLTKNDGYSADGVYVLDTLAGKRYLPARDPDGGCVCSSDLSSIMIAPGGRVTLSAVMAAIPAGSERVSVYVPTAGMFENIPVAR